MSFPVSLASSLSIAGTEPLSSYSHGSGVHVQDRADIIQLGRKLGLGTANAVASGTTALLGTGGTQSAWGQITSAYISNNAMSLLQPGSNIVADVTATTATWVDAGVSISYTAGGQGKVIILVSGLMANDSGSAHRANIGLWDGTVGSGILLAYADGSGIMSTHACFYVSTLTGSHTLRIGINNPAATGTARLYSFSLSWGVVEVKR